MIEYQEPHSNKRIYIKIIAWVVLFVFTWNQIAYSGDLFSFRPAPITAVQDGLRQVKDKEVEVTNYDLFNYKKKASGIQKILPSREEQEQSGTFAPDYLKRQQSKHEEIIRQKEDMDELVQDLLSRKRRPREEEELPLKKKRTVGAQEYEQREGKPLKYSLTDFDGLGNPNQLNVYDYNEDGSLKSITSYDITEKDISMWTGDAEEIETKEDGKFIFGSFDKEADLTGLSNDDTINVVYYKGQKGEEIIDYILSGFYEDKATQITIYDYDKTGDEALDETKTYDIEGLDEEFSPENKANWISLATEDKLSRTNVYEGAKDEERIKYTLFDYDSNAPHQRMDYEYDTDGKLLNTHTYDISECVTDADRAINKDRILEQTTFTGEKDNEFMDQTYYFDESGNIVERKDYEYLEYDAKYFYKGKRRILKNAKVYNTEDLGGDKRTRGTGALTEESIFSGRAGREKIQQSFYYDHTGTVV
ncbi:MAG: hypothetical protein V3V42_03485, partial [Candidatus Omnitrophota bacterium]